VEEYYSIGQYEEDALKKLNELFKNMKLLFWWAEA
jgi:tRNA dimethylallyltransferase